MAQSDPGWPATVRYAFLVGGELSERVLAAFPELQVSETARAHTTLYYPSAAPPNCVACSRDSTRWDSPSSRCGACRTESFQLNRRGVRSPAPGDSPPRRTRDASTPRWCRSTGRSPTRFPDRPTARRPSTARRPRRRCSDTPAHRLRRALRVVTDDGEERRAQRRTTPKSQDHFRIPRSPGSGSRACSVRAPA